ncbi:MAG: neutral/alkaline non-lysosomal ceramidase N-terminal domain-containing protein [Verrucomicrobiaceae bacterium]|nr:neutral/alkaline non-lysosomal ceramidase N-terminal domain-containing protein [Verrucomicrobiaceae bacterium]
MLKQLSRFLAAALSVISFTNAAPPGATPLAPPGPVKSVAPQVPAEWKAGTATLQVTPQKLLWMAGYAARKKPAEGKVQELFAKALALEDSTGGKLVFVTLDLIGVPQALRHEIARRAQQDYGLKPERLVLNASHTHSGPSLRSAPLTAEEENNPRAKDAWDYTQKLQSDLISLIGSALTDLKPARLTWNKARCGFAMNRRKDYTLPPDHPNANKVPNPNGPVDHEVPALRVETPDGALRAVMFGYACHNTSLGFYNWCGDYAGFAQEYLQEHRKDFTALFLMGCGGDQNPYPRRSDVVPGVTDLELSMHHGRSLANAVEMALTVNPIAIRGPIRAAYEEITLSYAKAGRPEHAYPVQVIKLGPDLTFVTLGSEVVVDYSLRFKKELAGEAGIWVAGYSNDYTGYIPSLRIQKEGGYEAAAGWAEDVEERIVDTVHKLHQSLK